MNTKLEYAEFERTSPSRRPDWRWQRAQRLVYFGQYFSAKRDDHQTGRLVAFLRGMHSRRSWRRNRALEAGGDIAAAHALHKNAGATRWLVQARLLAGLPPEQIATQSDMSVETIQAYEHCFFNISDRLAASAWITIQAIGYAACHRTTPTIEVLLKYVGYHGGPRMLELAGPVLLAPGGPQLVGPADEWHSQAGRQTLLVRLAIAAHLLPSTPTVIRELRRTRAQILEKERADADWAVRRRSLDFGLDLLDRDLPTVTDVSTAEGEDSSPLDRGSLVVNESTGHETTEMTAAALAA